jgi:hypothetical protein
VNGAWWALLGSPSTSPLEGQIREITPRCSAPRLTPKTLRLRGAGNAIRLFYLIQCNSSARCAAVAPRWESGSIGVGSFGQRSSLEAGVVRRRAEALCQVSEVASMNDVSSPSNNRWSGRAGSLARLTTCRSSG